MLDKIYNFVKLDFVIDESYNSAESLKVYAECGIEYNKLISLVNPITKFEFINELGQIVLTAKFKCSIALINVVENGNFELVKQGIVIDLLQYMHAMALGYFAKYNETQIDEKLKITLLPINYNEVVTQDLLLG